MSNADVLTLGNLNPEDIVTADEYLTIFCLHLFLVNLFRVSQCEVHNHITSGQSSPENTLILQFDCDNIVYRVLKGFDWLILGHKTFLMVGLVREIIKALMRNSRIDRCVGLSVKHAKVGMT